MSALTDTAKEILNVTWAEICRLAEEENLHDYRMITGGLGLLYYEISRVL